MTFAWEYTNMCCLLHSKAEGHGSPTVNQKIVVKCPLRRSLIHKSERVTSSFSTFIQVQTCKFNSAMWSSKQQNMKPAQEQLDTIIQNMYQNKHKTLHCETEMYEIWASWPVPNFHGGNAATQGNGIWGCPLTDNIHERVNFQRKSSTSEGLIYDVCFGICRHYRLLLQ